MLQLRLTKRVSPRIMLALLMLIVIDGGDGVLAPPAFAYERKVLMGVDAEFKLCFKLTDDALQKLRETYPEEYCKIPINNLQNLQSYLFCSQDDFLTAVQKAAGDFCYSQMQTENLLEYAEYPGQLYGFDDYSYRNNIENFVTELGPQPVKALACGRRNDTDKDCMMFHVLMDQNVAQVMSVDAVFSSLTVETTTTGAMLSSAIERRSTETAREVTIEGKNVCELERPRVGLNLLSVRAWMPDSSGDLAILEKTKVALYKKKTFTVTVRRVLLPKQQTAGLNLDVLDGRRIQTYLNSVFKQAAIQWEVDYARTDDVYDYEDPAQPLGDDSLQHPNVPRSVDPSQWVEYDRITNMPALAGMTAQFDVILLLVGSISPDTLAGFAVGQHAFVEIYLEGSKVKRAEDLLETIAHELGHTLGLEDLCKPASGAPGCQNHVYYDPWNLMWYGEGTKLRYNQWKTLQQKNPIQP